MTDITPEWMLSMGFGVVYGGGTPANKGFGLLMRDFGNGRSLMVFYGSAPCGTKFWWRAHTGGGELNLMTMADVNDLLAEYEGTA